MSNELSVGGKEVSIEWVRSATDADELLLALKDVLSLSVRSVHCAAMIVRRLDELGGNRAAIEGAVSPGVLRSLRRIGSGKMLPEVFIMLTGKVQDSVAELPILLQRRLCNGEKVTLVGPDRVGRKVSVDQLGYADAAQVFLRGSIRTVPEQLAYLNQKAKKVEAGLAYRGEMKKLVDETRESREDPVSVIEREERAEQERLHLLDGDGSTEKQKRRNLIEYHAEKLSSLLFSTGEMPKFDPDQRELLKKLAHRINQILNQR